MMRVLIDAHMLGEREGGNETYLAGLLQGFAALAPADVELRALCRPDQTSGLPVPAQALPAGGDVQRVFRDIPRLCRQHRADLVHLTYNASPFLPCPLALTVHDVIFRRYPSYFSPRVRLLLNTLLPLSMWRAAVIITDSRASQAEIEHYYRFTRSKTYVVPLGPGPIASVRPDTAAAEKLTAGRRFILAVGTVQPRKNLGRLIEAYLSLRECGLTEARLIIVGRKMWQSALIQQRAEHSPYAADIVFTGYLDDAAVAALYQRCAVFAYPSLYEGFGLPVLEAMACGAPVITSNVSSLPEVAGEAALLVNPCSIEEIAEAIQGVLSNPSLRDDLRRRGAQRAAQFTWERTAQATLEAYRRALARRGRA
jgi:glycosyltransferase involved in cell wall biosynthesis